MNWRMHCWSSCLARPSSMSGAQQTSHAAPPPRGSEHRHCSPLTSSDIVAASSKAFCTSFMRLRRRLTVLPLVCKRWARILGQASPAWEQVDFDWLYKRSNDRGAGRLRVVPEVISTWFGRYRPSV